MIQTPKTRTFSFCQTDAALDPAKMQARIKQALGAFHGMRAADPAPTADVYLAPEKGGRRAYQVELGAYRSTGFYDVRENEVVERSWGPKR